MSARLDRRIELLEPVTADNDYNETQINFDVAYSNFPAHRKDSVTTDGEKQEGQVIQASNVTEWEIRFIPNLNIKSTWKIRDMFSGEIYQIISPVAEIGRREGYRIKTMVVE